MTGLSSCAAALFDGTPKMKDFVVTSVPVPPPPLKLNATGGVATAGADIEDNDEPKVNGAPAGFTSETVGGVLGAPPKENGEDITSPCFFS